MRYCLAIAALCFFAIAPARAVECASVDLFLESVAGSGLKSERMQGRAIAAAMEIYDDLPPAAEPVPSADAVHLVEAPSGMIGVFFERSGRVCERFFVRPSNASALMRALRGREI